MSHKLVVREFFGVRTALQDTVRLEQRFSALVPASMTHVSLNFIALYFILGLRSILPETIWS